MPDQPKRRPWSTRQGSDFVTIAEFCKRTGYCRGSVYNLVERGEIAAPVRLGPNRVAFRTADYETWAQSRAPKHERLFELIDEACPQEPTGGRTIKKFEW